ncbi:TetR/AcrR family transcriptional regulator C-terminal domain-containing protein [Actinoplanes sp. RD1]|uniref:TetR/AcrR family transcriptional regulator C-terminal domain-containing protein n=1 Tax=Actinoplanes sp. RD1 TaxID=3064538 RepID=UPI002741FCC9|nr:TetR/AcrR family transcriptional regulator C-terminal domain-containing protein [Actinoplanes sp. RD1]
MGQAKLRQPLSRDRVLRAAVAVADRDGIEALTMRRLAEEVGAEAMSLYHHVANKQQILDGVIEVVLGEVNEAVGALRLPSRGAAWKAAVRARALTARQVFLRHPWAPAVLESRTTPLPAVLIYHDGVAGLLRDGGFTYDQIHHALHALGSRALGFTQELFDPGGGPAADLALPPEVADALPNLAAMLAGVAHDEPASTLGWCDDQAEFEFGLDLLLDGLDRLR